MKTPTTDSETSTPRMNSVERKKPSSGELPDDDRKTKKAKVDHYEGPKDVPKYTSPELKTRADETLKRVNELRAAGSLPVDGPQKFLRDEEIKKVRHHFL